MKMKMKGVIASALLLLLILASSFIDHTDAVPVPMAEYCGAECGRRCAKAGMKDRCMRFCGICCRECKCVPSGTFGNKHECPCYRDKLNSKGNPKCP